MRRDGGASAQSEPRCTPRWPASAPWSSAARAASGARSRCASPPRAATCSSTTPADAEAAEETAAECRASGVEAEALRADAGNREELAALFARAAEWGGVDLLVNNAARGLERPRPAIAQRPGHLHSTMDVNLFGPWQAAQAAVPLMEERGGGGIVNLLSPGAWQYMPDYSAVAVSKAALASLTRYLAVELAPRGIRVNAVSAGWVEASEGEHSYRGGVSDAVRPHVPAGRNVAPEDVAAAVAWVCSGEAPMLVGQTIHLDGGFGLAAWNAILDPDSAAE